MGGGGGYNTFRTVRPEELRQQVREAELSLAEAQFGPQLARLLDTYLAAVNDRDVDAINARLEEIKAALRDALEDSIDLRLGGSVAKHTYVDGLSDVDSLLVIRTTHGAKIPPRQVLAEVAMNLSSNLDRNVRVSTGTIAITISYPNGPEIQLIPAVRDGQRLFVPSWRHSGWSKINPRNFTRGLTKRNDECNKKLIPTIKLAKAINSKLPKGQQLTGYHIESLAIAAFRDYDGPKTTVKMLPYFVRRIPALLKTPIRDRTGQSVHVDEYLGKSNSIARRRTAQVFERIARRMENATAARSLEQWQAIIDDS